MTEKQSNLIVRTVTGVLFVAVMVTGMAFRPEALILLFALITGLTTWEYCGIVNRREDISVNRFITTAAAVYLNHGEAEVRKHAAFLEHIRPEDVELYKA